MEWTGIGRFIGKEAIRKQWKAVKDGFLKHNPPDYMHLAPQIMGYVTIDPDGKTGYGRWYAAGSPHGAAFLYENTYRKENGVWKMHTMRCGGFPTAPSTLGGAGADSSGGKSQAPVDEIELEKKQQEYMSQYDFTERISRVPRQEWGPWVRPFHFKHPVTGKDVNKTSVKAHNDSYPVPMPPGGENWTAKR